MLSILGEFAERPWSRCAVGLDYKTNAPIAPEELAALFRSSGIRRSVDDLSRLARMIENANLTITAWGR